MRHLVNFGLLFCFGTLVASGAMAFFLPFSLVTTRVHILFGMATTILVGLHLSSRLPYFRGQLFGRQKGKISPWTLLAVVATWALLLTASITGWTPTQKIVDQSYESRHRAQIVRSMPLSGFDELGTHRRMVARLPSESGAVALSLFVSFEPNIETVPAMAVWAESTNGSIIETLYLDPRLAYAEEPDWGGQHTKRSHILPIWRHRWTVVSGIDPNGQFDALTQPTPSHKFSLDNYLRLGQANEFVLCVEINTPGDPNETFTDPHVGQPSVLYTAYVDVDSPQPYALLELTGHGGGAETSGAIQYDLDPITTARSIVDLLLVKAERDIGESAPKAE